MKTLAIIMLAITPAFAGISKFTAKKVVKPAAKVSAKAVKASAHASVKAVKVAAKAAY